MSKIDIILLIPLAWGAFIGFKKGLVLELASLVGLMLGIYGALKFSDYTAHKLNTYVEVSTEWIGLLSFLITFAAIVFAVFLLAKILDKALKLVALGLVNRLLGMLFGIAKYALILSILLFIFQNLNVRFQFTEEPITNKSILVEPIQMVSGPFSNLMTDFQMDSLSNKMEELAPNLE